MRTIDGLNFLSKYELRQIERIEERLRNEEHVSMLIDYSMNKVISFPDSGGLSPMVAAIFRDNFLVSELRGEMVPLDLNDTTILYGFPNSSFCRNKSEIKSSTLIVIDYFGKDDF